MATRIANGKALQTFRVQERRSTRGFWDVLSLRLAFCIMLALCTILTVGFIFIWSESRPEPQREGVNSSDVGGAESPLQNQNEPPGTPQNSPPPVTEKTPKEKAEPSPTPKATETPPKPPAPKGFFKDGVRLGMTRKAVHQLIEQWKPTGEAQSQSITPVPYTGVEKISVCFEDGEGLVVEKFPPQSLYSKWVYTKSTVLRPASAEARLTDLGIEFDDELKEGSPKEFLDSLRKRFGSPDSEGKPQPFGLTGSELRLDAGGFVSRNDQELRWTWPDIDRTVSARVTRYGSGALENLNTFTLTVTFADGLLARKAVQEALEKERQRRERVRTDAAKEALRAAIADGRTVQPKEGTADATADTLLLIPKDLLGRWHVRGTEPHGTRWEGYLTVNKGTDREAKGAFDWIEGNSVGQTTGTVTLLNAGPAHAGTLVFRSDGDSHVVERGAQLDFAAVLTSDKKELIAGRVAGGWRKPGWFFWRATKLTDAPDPEKKHPSPAGKWQVNGGWSFTVEEKGSDYPLRRIFGSYTYRHWTWKESQTFRLVGNFNLQTRRVWFGVSGGSDINGEAYLSEDGNKLHGGGWEAIRDHLVPVPKPKWRLFLPLEATSGGHGGGVDKATRLLEGILDAYEIDATVPLKSGGYAYLTRTKDKARLVSHLKDLKELPEGTKGWTFSTVRVGEAEYDSPFIALLKRYQLPPSDSISLELPKNLVERMRNLELEHWKKSPWTKGKDPRLLRETEFEITYDRKDGRLSLEVRKQDAAEKLSW